MLLSTNPCRTFYGLRHTLPCISAPVESQWGVQALVDRGLRIKYIQQAGVWDGIGKSVNVTVCMPEVKTIDSAANCQWESKELGCRAFRRIKLKSFIATRLNSILVNLRYLRFKLLKYKENNKKICNTFNHNFKNIPLYIMRKVSLERYYFVLYDCALTSKMSKMVLKSFCDKTLQLFSGKEGGRSERRGNCLGGGISPLAPRCWLIQ